MPALGSPTSRDANRTPGHRPLVELAEQGRERYKCRVDSVECFSLSDELDGLVREVERGFEVREEVEQVVAEGFERPCDAPASCASAVQVRIGPRLNDRVNGLCLRKVFLPREERAERELARIGRSRAGGKKVCHKTLDEGGRADDVQFREVLARVRSWTGEKVERRGQRRVNARERE